ncbi:MAG: hypothetical protein PSN35_03920 [Candidatus Thioglobus sp.]|nr:hypothetical protein [Candidatus Thioglobus sp.]MDC9726966.1 hypothetical protein [Candidatus Thioglobus sp.]
MTEEEKQKELDKINNDFQKPLGNRSITQLKIKIVLIWCCF